ncbi:hypothetical protein [Lignipirellula cremea]|uniref:Uncharacterized protein n=1 Tax=Lignipirellula cremea TaxID=2528010 RepID=A0A518E2W6_9BACT|nr:hypothetical protein [Lignipirellula cremea]QDU98439.1 hypothetical protein Pla8534_63070 [Lignipirellula cremea]
MLDGDELIRWTVRFALLFYVAAIALGIGDPGSRWRTAANVAWTLGCLCFLGHVAAAMQFYHHWSHAHAFADTAVQTQSQLGWSFGYGIYFSYLFTLLWVVDAAWSWRAAGRSPMRMAIHAYMFFIALNGAIVFHSGPTRWLGAIACLGLGVLLLVRWRSAHGSFSVDSAPADSSASEPATVDSANLEPSPRVEN